MLAGPEPGPASLQNEGIRLRPAPALALSIKTDWLKQRYRRLACVVCVCVGWQMKNFPVAFYKLRGGTTRQIGECAVGQVASLGVFVLPWRQAQVNTECRKVRGYERERGREREADWGRLGPTAAEGNRGAAETVIGCSAE